MCSPVAEELADMVLSLPVHPKLTEEDLKYIAEPEKYGIDREKYTQENIIEKVLVNKVEPLKVELRTFVDCVKKNAEFPVTPEQAVNNMRKDKDGL